MKNLLVDERDQKFVLFEQLRVDELGKTSLYGHISRDVIDLSLGAAVDLAVRESYPTMADADRGATFLTKLISGKKVETVHVIGPAPCAIERIKSRYRWHVLLRARRSAELTRVLTYFATHFKPEGRSDMRVVIDRDPVTLL